MSRLHCWSRTMVAALSAIMMTLLVPGTAFQCSRGNGSETAVVFEVICVKETPLVPGESIEWRKLELVIGKCFLPCSTGECDPSCYNIPPSQNDYAVGSNGSRRFSFSIRDQSLLADITQYSIASSFANGGTAAVKTFLQPVLEPSTVPSRDFVSSTSSPFPPRHSSTISPQATPSFPHDLESNTIPSIRSLVSANPHSTEDVVSRQPVAYFKGTESASGQTSPRSFTKIHTTIGANKSTVDTYNVATIATLVAVVLFSAGTSVYLVGRKIRKRRKGPHHTYSSAFELALQDKHGPSRLSPQLTIELSEAERIKLTKETEGGRGLKESENIYCSVEDLLMAKGICAGDGPPRKVGEPSFVSTKPSEYYEIMEDGEKGFSRSSSPDGGKVQF